jgi:hypothetical protein
MIKAVRQKKRKKRRLYLVGLVVILLAAAGGTLHRFSLSLQDISRIVQLAAGKVSAPAAVVRPATDVLRGTVYDRNYKELSVSYQLYSLYVHPAELTDRRQVAQVLGPILGIDGDALAAELKSEERVVELADDLDEEQAARITALGLKGVICKPVEERYYPAHAVGAHLLGFTGKGTGLSGVEAVYDPVLQPGEFRDADVPEVDLEGVEKLGMSTDDVILTIDLDLQKQVEQQLQDYRRKKGAARGCALVLDPGNGRILAMASQPGFDPNYFWQAGSEQLKNHVFSREIDPALVRPLLLSAAAIYDAGLDHEVLPVTVRAPDFGLAKEKIQRYSEQFAFARPAADPLALEKNSSANGTDKQAATGLLSSAQVAVGVASLINGGNRTSLYLFSGIYDHQRKQLYHRDTDLIQRERIIPPAAGIHLRRELLLNSPYSRKQGFVFTNRLAAVTNQGGLSEYRLQEILVAAVPRKSPKVMLLMIVDYGTLYPLPDTGGKSRKSRKKKKQNDLLADLGSSMLPLLARYGINEHVAEHPAGKAEENYRRFLISRRLDLPVEKKEYGLVEHRMPEVVGLSLRKGLQQISPYGLQVSISGSGRIVRQEPAPGTLLSRSAACQLVLDSNI